MKRFFVLFLCLVLVLGFVAVLPLVSVGATEVFSNGFEEGDFSAWTGTSGSPAIVESPVHHGTYAAECEGSENVYYTFTGMSEAYARLYFQFTTAPSVSGQLEVCDLFVTTRDNGIRCLVYNDAGTLKWRVSVLNSGLGTTVDTADSPNPIVDTWYCIELYWKAGTAGGAKLYVDDALVLTTSATTRSENVDRLRPKNYNVGASYFDCVVLSDSYVGVEGEAGEDESVSLVLNAPADDAEVNEFSQIMNYTPVLYGSDKFYNATLYVNNTAVAYNATALVNNTLNSISYTFSSNGTFVWDVLVWNSTHGVFSSNGNWTVVVSVPASVYEVDLTIVRPENITYSGTVYVELSTSGNETDLVVTWNCFFANSSWLYETNQTYSGITSFGIGENCTMTFCGYVEGEHGASDYGEVEYSVLITPEGEGEYGEEFVYGAVAAGVLLAMAFSFMLFYSFRGKRKEDVS